MSLAVMGQEAVLEALQGLEAHTLLFAGPSGVGRRRAARWLAAYLNCQADEGRRPCGACRSCLLAAGDHPDYREVAPRESTASGRVNRRPEIVIGQLVPRPGEHDPLSRWLEQRPAFRRRVGVLDGADRLTRSAANAFLKMLEEPPSFAVIVLVAPSPQALLPTVASRCTVLRFPAVDTSALGVPGHPAHHLGRPGPVLEARADAEAFASAMATVERFVSALGRSLEEALRAADDLEKLWANSGTIDVAELLRAQLRQLPPQARLRADDVVLACEEAIASYASSGLAIKLLTLELRAALA